MIDSTPKKREIDLFDPFSAVWMVYALKMKDADCHFKMQNKVCRKIARNIAIFAKLWYNIKIAMKTKIKPSEG